MKPAKPYVLRVPLRPPPSEAERARRGLVLRKMRKLVSDEAAEDATERARSFAWFGSVVEEKPYGAKDYWLFLAKEAA